MSKVDELLHEIGLSRDDISYKYKKKDQVWFVPTFNALWWIITAVAIVGALCWIHVLVVLLTFLAA